MVTLFYVLLCKIEEDNLRALVGLVTYSRLECWVMIIIMLGVFQLFARFLGLLCDSGPVPAPGSRSSGTWKLLNAGVLLGRIGELKEDMLEAIYDFIVFIFIPIC